MFATGGIGGVHRDASESGDISADLTALSRIPVAVVSAGAKAILDLPRTVEMLETLGVPVFGFGPTNSRRSTGDRPDSRGSPLRLHHGARVGRATPPVAGLGTGVLIANPIPSADEMASELYDRALHTALSEAETRRIRAAR